MLNRVATGGAATPISQDKARAAASRKKPLPMRPSMAWSMATAAKAGVAKPTTIDNASKAACPANQRQAPPAWGARNETTARVLGTVGAAGELAAGSVTVQKVA